MRIEIKDGGDGVRCWNVGAIQAYATGISDQETRLSSANPDLSVKPGRIRCYGCELMEYDYGTRCTALLTRTRYAVAGELEPRAEDAEAPLSEIPGLLTRAPEAGVGAQPPAATAAAAPAAPTPARSTSRVLAPPPTPAPPKRSGLRGMFGR